LFGPRAVRFRPNGPWNAILWRILCLDHLAGNNAGPVVTYVSGLFARRRRDLCSKSVRNWSGSYNHLIYSERPQKQARKCEVCCIFIGLSRVCTQSAPACSVHPCLSLILTPQNRQTTCCTPQQGYCCLLFSCSLVLLVVVPVEASKNDEGSDRQVSDEVEVLLAVTSSLRTLHGYWLSLHTGTRKHAHARACTSRHAACMHAQAFCRW
jgi:hypothetical protein